MEKKNLLVYGCVCAVAFFAWMPAFALLHGDTPDARHAWAVQDWNRPCPAKVTAAAVCAPSDAIVLFDGTAESLAKNWSTEYGGSAKWKVEDGVLVCVPRTGTIKTKRLFGDCQLHVEWRSPKGTGSGRGQANGNSGVILMDKCEIQVLDSWDTDPAKPEANPNYADGLAGAIYGQNPPAVNPTRPAGEWQSYDIVLHYPVWEGNKMIQPATITMFFNGVLVHDEWQLDGPPYNKRYAPPAKHPAKLPIRLQDHNSPVAYRNVWIREIPSRRANTTHGGPFANASDVMALRHATARRLAAKIKPGATDANAVERILEVIAYAKEEPYVSEMKRICAAYQAKIKSLSDAEIAKRRNELRGVNHSIGVLVRCNLMDENDDFAKTIGEIVKSRGWDKEPLWR